MGSCLWPVCRLLLAAASCEQGDSSTHERVRREAAALGDWARLQHVARAHRMLPFVVDAVAWSGVQVPAPTMQSLLHERLEIAAGAWRAVHETAALHRRLTDAGVRAAGRMSASTHNCTVRRDTPRRKAASRVVNMRAPGPRGITCDIGRHSTNGSTTDISFLRDLPARGRPLAHKARGDVN